MILLDPEARPVIAHRGASGQYPENTLLAFTQALEQGADAIELDVRATADGVAVVLHDPTLERTTNGVGPLGRQPLSAIRELDAGRGERIPTLADVLDRLPATPLLVEIKEPRAAGPTLAELRRHGAERRAVVGAFQWAAVAPFRDAGVARCPARVEVAVFWAMSRLGLSLRTSGYRAFSVPEYSGRRHVVDRRFVAAARRAGLPVHVWTVDDPVAAHRLRSLGVCGIVTNYPARMRGAMPTA